MKKLTLAVIMIAYLLCGLWNIDWGLYSSQREQFLFPAESDWSPERVAEIQTSKAEASESLGADVDPNPTAPASTPVDLNDTDDKIAEIHSRYLLYSSHPDEMITFRALGEMNPQKWELDPKLYQYGGLFIYPIGALAKGASLLGWVELGSKEYYLNNPTDFAKFYILGRGYVLAWGLLGLCIVYGIGSRLSDWRAGALSALIFSLMPVVVSLSHESKPHLPGTVLMLWAVLWAIKYIESGRPAHRFMLALACGLALGMALSSLWIIVLIPLAELLLKSTYSSISDRIARSVFFIIVALCTYVLTNPYVAINLVIDREVLASNFSNSAAMYHVGDFHAGLANAWFLLLEGSSIFLTIGGLVMLVALWGWDWRRTLILIAPAALMFAQLITFAEGKPGEYGRFAIFPNAVLCIVVAVGCFRFLANKWFQGTIYSLALASAVAWPALRYFESLHRDGTNANSRYELAGFLQSETQSRRQEAVPEWLEPPTWKGTIGVLRDPAPYCFPPTDFSKWHLVLLPKSISEWPEDRSGWPEWLIVPLDGVEGVEIETILQDGYYQHVSDEPMPSSKARITWANKPLLLLKHTSASVEKPE